MYAKTLITLFAAVSAVSARAIVRRSQPDGWWTDGLEDYTTYHDRYLALDCQDQHDTTFFESCCHPLLANETTADLPSECTVSSASASADAAEETSSATVSDDVISSTSVFTTSTAAASSTETASASATTSIIANENYRQHGGSSSSSSDFEVQVSTSTSIEAAQWTSTSTSSTAASTSTSSSSGETFTGGYATFFYQNGVAGACGTVHSDSDIIAAIDSDRYDSGSLCGQQVTITNTDNGKSVTVTIADECPTCDNSNSIDLSTGAFDEIADESSGIVPISWSFA